MMHGFVAALITALIVSTAAAQPAREQRQPRPRDQAEPRASGDSPESERSGRAPREYKRVPISYAIAVDRSGRAVHEGDNVEVVGVASVASTVFFNDKTKLFVQDDAAGVVVFGRRLEAVFQAGDILRVRGRVKMYAGAPELLLHTIDRIGRGVPPVPLSLTPEDLLSRRYSGRLVKVRGTIVGNYSRSTGTDIALSAGDDLLYARLTAHQRASFPIDELKPGATIEITGIASPFERTPGATRWQTLPRTAADIRILSPPPLFTFRELGMALSIVAALLLLALIWIALLRLQVQRKTAQYREIANRLSLLGQTVESTKDLVSVSDMTEHFMFVNSAFLQAYGYTREAILGKHVSIVDSPNNPPGLRAEISGAVQEEGWRGELLNRRSDGTEFPIALTTSVIHDDRGNRVGLVGVARDITEQRRIQQQLFASEARYRLLFDRNPLPTWLFDDESGRILAVNDAAVQKYGYARDEMTEMAIDKFFVGDANPVGVTARAGGERLEVARHRLKNGQEIYVELTEHMLEFGGRSVRLLVANDITERKLAQEQVEYQAFHDGLTGLPNRRLFLDRLSMHVALASRTGSSPVVMFVDLDRFKRINDTLGHWAGDDLLKQVADRLKRTVRQSDTVARVGGDEFTLVLAQEEKLPAEGVLALANKILGEFSRPFLVGDRELWVTSSIGVAVHPEDGVDADTLLKRADFAMYRAKELGRNNYQLSRGISEPPGGIDSLSLEDSLHRALERNEFVLLYQPQLDVRSGRVIGAEALLRWRHPERGVLLPGDFIGLAEESQLIVPIGDWVLGEACAQLQAWHEAGLVLPVAVNLSARQFQRADFGELLAQKIDECGIDASRLELEITERVAMQNVDRTSALLRTVKELGVKVAMDDFGTGYSSLGYLKYFPIDTVKVDQTFVRDITVDASDAAIVSAVIAMAHSLKLRVIAEGVETAEQLQFLVEHRCDAFQGFLVSEALTAEEIANFVAEQPIAI